MKKTLLIPLFIMFMLSVEQSGPSERLTKDVYPEKVTCVNRCSIQGATLFLFIAFFAGGCVYRRQHHQLISRKKR